MKYLLFCCAFIVFFACDNELDILEDKKDIPIVYGVLSIADSAQYIRIERAFVDDQTSAFDLAQIPDSLYYPNLSVKIRQEATGEEFDLIRVDGNFEGYVREEGTFAQSPNYLYKILSSDIPLIEDTEYTLLIDRGSELPIVEATTRIVGSSRITTPLNSIGFDYIQPTKVRWRSGAGAKTFDVRMVFHYRERITSSNDDFEDRSAEWVMTQNYVSTGAEIENLEIPGINFYSFLSGTITADPEIERRVGDVDLILDSGGQEILDLNRVSGANLGITSSQDVPFYSNISEGRGVFSSKHTATIVELPLKSGTIDSIVGGTITRDLNFK